MLSIDESNEASSKRKRSPSTEEKTRLRRPGKASKKTGSPLSQLSLHRNANSMQNSLALQSQITDLQNRVANLEYERAKDKQRLSKYSKFLKELEHQVFFLFENFPTEIREKNWEYATKPRFHTVFFKDENDSKSRETILDGIEIFSRETLPLLSRVCPDSRNAFKHFFIRFGVYVDPQIDTIWLSYTPMPDTIMSFSQKLKDL